MRLTLENPSPTNVVRGYRDGEIRIGETLVTSSCLVAAQTLILDLRPRNPAELEREDLEPLFALKPEVAIVGWAADRGWDRHPVKLFNAMLVAEIVMMAMGFAWLALLIGPEKSWQFGVLPFIVGDLIKVALAASLVPAAWSLLPKSSCRLSMTSCESLRQPD